MPRILLAFALLSALFVPAAPAQTNPDQPDPPQHAEGSHSSHQGMHHPGMHHSPGEAPMSPPSGELPDEPGQSAFAAMAEIRAMLVADPDTDWSRVDFDALREHLVDMDRVVMTAEVGVTEVPGGFRARVTGEGRTLAAIRRMVPDHTRFMNGREGLETRVTDLSGETEGSAEGVEVAVTTGDAEAVPRLQALGFFGFLTAGDHHRPHHLMMARGSHH